MVRPASLPITLLYIDFPGLGDRWEEATKDTATGLFRAHDHFSDTVAALGGQPVSAWLDARCASFAAPAVAVAAALAFQDRASKADDLPWCQALASGSTGIAGKVPVPLLHCVRQLSESGGRNRVLLASSTAELVAQDLPRDTRLGPLGPWQLSDSSREQVFQLLVPDPAGLICPHSSAGRCFRSTLSDSVSSDGTGSSLSSQGGPGEQQADGLMPLMRRGATTENFPGGSTATRRLHRERIRSPPARGSA